MTARLLIGRIQFKLKFVCFWFYGLIQLVS
jgi:hypothetical protein